MKFSYTLLGAICATLTFSLNAQITRIEHEIIPRDGHDHSHLEGSLTNPDEHVDLLKGFDLAAANKAFDKLGYHENERFGYIQHQKTLYLIKTFPEKFVNKDKDKVPPPMKSANCPNAGFENLTFNPQWTGGTATYGVPITNNVIQTNGINAAYNDALARHTILTTAPINNNPINGAIVGYDPVAINPMNGIAQIPYLAPGGGGSSVRLGNAATGAQIERLRYIINVTNDNKAFYYQFAVIFQNPASHGVNEQPYFKIRFLDQNNQIVGGNCGQYNVLSSQAVTDTSFKLAQGGSNAVYYRKWDRVDVDLTQYVGQQITVEFESADCSLSGHYGYAYIDAGCQTSIDSEVSYCAGDAYAELVAPAGFPSYQWYGPNDATIPIVGATNDTLQVPTPNLLDTFYVKITTTNGCELFQSIVINYSTLAVENISLTNTCYGAGAGSVDITASGSNQGYLFDFQPINVQNTTGFLGNMYTGNYMVHVSSPNPTCGVVDTVFFIDVAPVFPSNLAPKFCEGVGEVTAPNSPVFYWYDNNQQLIPPPVGNQQTIVDSNAYTGKKYYLAYQLPSGCFDTLIYTFQDNKVGSKINLSRPQGCRSISLTFDDLTPNSDTLTFSMNGPNGYVVVFFDTVMTNFTTTNLDTGTYYVRYIDEGCFYDTTFTVVDVVSTAVHNFVFCPEDQYFLSSLPTGAHSWTNPTGTVIGTTQNITISNIIEGAYIDSCAVLPGCYALTTYNMDSITMVTDYEVQNNICNGGSDGEIYMSYLDGPTGNVIWTVTSPSGFPGNNDTIVGLPAGTYIVQTKVLNCTHYDTIFVDQPEVSGDTLTIYTQICSEIEGTTLYAPEGFYNYQWFHKGSAISNANSSSLEIDYPTLLTDYTVTYNVPPNGCVKRTIKFDTEPFHYGFAPTKVNNVFSPNGDEVNGIYHPFNDQNWEVGEIDYVTRAYRMVVYNRWGAKVFETDQYKQGWDGTTFSGKEVSDGSYFVEVTFQAKCESEEKFYKFVQNVQVVR